MKMRLEQRQSGAQAPDGDADLMDAFDIARSAGPTLASRCTSAELTTRPNASPAVAPLSMRIFEPCLPPAAYRCETKSYARLC
jgi:hypothetical protein